MFQVYCWVCLDLPRLNCTTSAGAGDSTWATLACACATDASLAICFPRPRPPRPRLTTSGAIIGEALLPLIALGAAGGAGTSEQAMPSGKTLFLRQMLLL